MFNINKTWEDGEFRVCCLAPKISNKIIISRPNTVSDFVRKNVLSTLTFAVMNPKR